MSICGRTFLDCRIDFYQDVKIGADNHNILDRDKSFAGKPQVTRFMNDLSFEPDYYHYYMLKANCKENLSVFLRSKNLHTQYLT